jgi:hypothetical protein
MTDRDENAVSKVHPASREMLADDPLSLHGVEVPGDVDVMMCMLVEDYARMGWDLKGIVTLAGDPFYQAFHGLYLRLGEDSFRRRVSDILSRVGVTRVKTVEAEPPPADLVEIELPASFSREDDQSRGDDYA